jgi:hypothetical protein
MSRASLRRCERFRLRGTTPAPRRTRRRSTRSAMPGSGKLARVTNVLRPIASLITVACFASACSADHQHGAARNSTSSTSTGPTPAVLAICPTPSRFGVGGASNEIRGTSRDASLWGLALGPGHIPPRPGDELKVVWRMTGTGPLHVTLDAPDGTRRPLVFGPEPHTASSYHRPGDEWGTGFRFEAAGCWHIHFARTDTSGDVWLQI